MQKILLISTIYPLPEGNHGTSVCHFFAREWVKMGYDMRVVHLQSTFPRFFYWLARFNRKRIAAKTGAVVYTHRDNKEQHYTMDGVPVMRLPLYKMVPHGKYSASVVSKAVQSISSWMDEEGFVPDVMIGHFPNPQIEVLSQLKGIYPQASTCMVMHGDVEMACRTYGERLHTLIKDIDMWGFRNKNVLSYFEKRIIKVNNPFMCYSGIPKEFVTDRNSHVFNGPLKRFVYVGELIERKFPSVIVDALSVACPDKDFQMVYVGEGQQRKEIVKKAEAYGLQDCIKLLGRIPRDQILAEYDQADCMVMISKWEAYGLVYLEAMARGCITIASKKEGFDGIIEDGVNGFLCKAGDAEELAAIIHRINSMTAEERQKVSENAIETAKRLTDEQAARLYINSITERME